MSRYDITLENKFTGDKNEARIYVDEEQKAIVAVFHEERHTLYLLAGGATPGVLMSIQQVLLHTWETTHNVLKVLEGMRELGGQGSYTVGEMKPSFSDMSWEDWCSPEQVTKEFYAYQERMRRKQRRG